MMIQPPVQQQWMQPHAAAVGVTAGASCDTAHVTVATYATDGTAAANATNSATGHATVASAVD